MPRQLRWEPPTVPFQLANVAPLGVTPRVLEGALDSGQITRLVRGVYIASRAKATDPEPAHLQKALAVQLRRPTAIASHHTAVLAGGLSLDDPVEAALSHPWFIDPRRPGVRSRQRGEVHVAVRNLPPAQRTAHPSGLLVTTPARAAVDVASGVDLGPALVVLDSAARLQLQDVVGSRVRDHYVRERSIAAACAPLLAVLPDAATHHTREWLNRVVPLADPRRESALESLSFAAMLRADLPLPELQARIVTAEGVCFPDYRWARAMVIGEADGMLKYQSHEDLIREKRRQELLEQMGYMVIRWEMRDLRRNPQALMERIRHAIASRSGGV